MFTKQTRDLDAGTFEDEVLRAERPVLVDFSAEWCPPCRMMDPVIDELAAALAGQLVVGRLDVDRHPEMAARFGILSMPTLIVFAGGRPVDRLVGFSSAGQVRRWVAGAIRDTSAPQGRENSAITGA